METHTLTYECMHLSLGVSLGGPVGANAKELKKVGTESKIMGAGFPFKFMGVWSLPLDLRRPKN